MKQDSSEISGSELEEKTLLHDLLNQNAVGQLQVGLLRDLLAKGDMEALEKELPERLKSIACTLLRVEKIIVFSREKAIKAVTPPVMSRKIHEIAQKTLDEHDEHHLDLTFQSDLKGMSGERVLYSSVLWWRILQNMVLNAQRANATKLNINISGVQKKKKNLSEVFMSVADNGDGISPEVLKKLKRNVRVTTKQDVNDGTEHGLGVLSIVQQIQQMAGKVTIHNQKDKGAEFRFLLSTQQHQK